MILIFSGRGWLLFVVWMTLGFTLSQVAEGQHGAGAFTRFPAYPGVACLVMAGCAYWLGQTWLREHPSVKVKTEEHGWVEVNREHHRMFFLPARAWAVIFAAVGLLLTGVGMIGAGL